VQPPSLTIRTAVGADLPDLQRIFRAASLSNPGDRAALLAHPEYLTFGGEGIPEGRTRVATLHGTPVGFATVSAADRGDVELEDLFVDPRAHRQGIARQLINDAAHTAGTQGHTRMVVTGNGHALAFYRAVGFVQFGYVRTPLGSAPRLELPLHDQA